MLEIVDLVAGYDGRAVVHGVSVEVPAGVVSLVVGVNGAGKSTSLRTVAGLHRPMAGRVRVDGNPVTGAPAHAMVRHGVVLVPEGRRVFAPLSVEENLRMGGYRRPRAELTESIESAYATFPIRAQRRNGPAGLLSGGEQQMLAIARGLMSKPRYMLLDEPSMGLAPVVIDEVMDRIRAIADSGVGVLMVEQNIDVGLSIADRVAVMARGEFVYHGDVTDGAAQEGVLTALLGGRGPADGAGSAGAGTTAAGSVDARPADGRS